MLKGEQRYQIRTEQVKKGAVLVANPIVDMDESVNPDDPNDKWKMDYCYWEAKPNPEAANEGVPQKLMIKSFPTDYYMTGSKDYNPAGETTVVGDGVAEDEVIGNLTSNGTEPAVAVNGTTEAEEVVADNSTDEAVPVVPLAGAAGRVR